MHKNETSKDLLTNPCVIIHNKHSLVYTNEIINQAQTNFFQDNRVQNLANSNKFLSVFQLGIRWHGNIQVHQKWNAWAVNTNFECKCNIFQRKGTILLCSQIKGQSSSTAENWHRSNRSKILSKIRNSPFTFQELNRVLILTPGRKDSQNHH